MTEAVRQGQLKLGALFHPTGNHVASWLHPESQIDAGSNFRHYAELAQTAERGKFDTLFLADALAIRDGDPDVMKRWPQYMSYFEPVTLLSALAAVTEHIGLIATSTTSYNEPFHVARRYASLDHISGGRAGWNVVTSTNPKEPVNFGRNAHFGHAERYKRAKEFVEVVCGLWDSWDDDAFVRDRGTATYFNPSGLHALHHHGDFFNVEGPLNIARPPQGYPVIAQAGSSEDGKELAAETAEIVFSAQTRLEAAIAFYQDLKGRMAKFGRKPEELKILPGLNPIIGRTEAEAREKHEYLQSLIHPSVGAMLLSAELGIDLTGLPVDEPVPDELIPSDTNASKSGLKIMVDMIRHERLTIRQMYLRYAGARGQRTIVGTPEQIANDMASWYRAHAVDGFLIQPATLPGGLNDFVDGVVPILQEMGVFRREYEGDTLRENLGLKRPAGRYAQAV